MAAREMPKGSIAKGALPEGCRLCARGSKMVLLVTGLCGAGCFYCPLSDKKRGKDVVYANELRAKGWKDIRREADLIGAEGAGITGGDPLRVTRRTGAYARSLKKAFGKDFHIHLYTASTDIQKIRAVVKAGVDEMRFHPPQATWKRIGKTAYPRAIAAAARAGANVGAEIPALPDMRAEIEALLGALAETDVAFVNLNELEFSETNWRRLKARGYSVKDDISSGVKGSEGMARTLVKAWKGPYALHYCSASYKDAVQLRNRLLRRAERVALPGDVRTDEGTLVKGVVETSHPTELRRKFMRIYRIPGNLIRVDQGFKRLEIAPWILEEIAGRLNEPSFIVEEYPTADRLEVERTPLKGRR
ncbi:MAG: radical SAM protein [Euryarchaeota archaeon]|nr:radical SAM protein [Euryarchaeota archaeon]